MSSVTARSSFLRSCLWALALAASSLPASAQSIQVSGTIKDPDQSVVSAAIVTLNSTQTATPLQTTTNDAGQYSFSSVAPGNYRLEAHKTGFVDAIVPSVIVTASQTTVTQDAAFALAGTASSVTVSGSGEGTPASGYYVENIDQGELGTAPVVNQPFMITEMPADEIANTQARNLKEAIKYLPLVSYAEQEGPEIIRPLTRGLQGAIEQNTMMDGMNMAITGGNAMEQYQEMQVVNGLASSIYGPANPSGMFDFVLKRPTNDRFENIYLEQDPSTVGTIYGDFSGRLGRRKIFGDGGQFVEYSRLRRRLAEFAFDVRPSDRTTLDAHYSVYDVVQRGYPGWFSYAPTVKLPDAPDPRSVGLGQAYAGVNLTTQSTSARLQHDFSSNWHAMMGGLGQRLDRFIDTPVNTLIDNNGDYNQSLAAGLAPRFGTESDLGYITGTVKKWHFKQDIVIGSNGYAFSQYSYTAPPAPSLYLGSANINDPMVFAAPAAGLPKNVGLYQAVVIHQQGFNLSDLIYFPKRFSVRLAASQDWIGVDNYKSATDRVSGSNKNGVSPSVSVMYKPTEGTTAYATFASALQQGDIAPTGTVNANQALAPYRSSEWELGFKTDDKPLNISTALFRLQRPFANTVPYGTAGQTIYEINGMQVNYGAEVSVQGTLFHRLLIDGGFTALNARLNDTGVAATDGKRFVGIPGYHSNLLTEYRVPGVANLSITGDWEFTGERPQDDENLYSTPAFNTFDVGFRYSHTLFTKLATLRFTTNNFTNTRYYSTIAPVDLTGVISNGNTAFTGAPRTISSSLEFSF
jgi:iron complex outermembrane receptor protein